MADITYVAFTNSSYYVIYNNLDYKSKQRMDNNIGIIISNAKKYIGKLLNTPDTNETIIRDAVEFFQLLIDTLITEYSLILVQKFSPDHNPCECGICYDRLTERQLPCKHSICDSCLCNHINSKKTNCPFCRGELFK